MSGVIFLSPHLDDVVLSCSALLRILRRKGISIRVVNVFDQSSLEFKEHYTKRHLEDRKALEFLGVESTSLGFLDAPFRKIFLLRKKRLLFGSAQEDSETLECLIQKLNGVFEKYQPNVVIAPMGVGWHLDHLLVHEAAMRSFPNERLRFYEDSPYSYVPYQSLLRLGNWDRENILSCCQNLVRSPYIRSFIPDWTEQDFQIYFEMQADLEKKISGRLRATLSYHIDSSRSELAAQAISHYNSQIDSLFDPELDFQSQLQGQYERYYKFTKF